MVSGCQGLGLSRFRNLGFQGLGFGALRFKLKIRGTMHLTV